MTNQKLEDWRRTMNKLPESSAFFTRNKEGELVAKVPEILNYLRTKTERAKEKYNTSDWEVIWCLNVIAGELIMHAGANHYLDG